MSKPGHGSLVCLSTTHGGKISFIKKINPPIRHLRGKVDMMLSLTSGTFVLLVRLFLHYHYEACEYEGADFAAWDANITAIFERPSDEERLLEAISRLKPEQKELVRAIYFDGESVNSYAAREGVSQSAISHRLKTVKNKLKKLLK